MCWGLGCCLMLGGCQTPEQKAAAEAAQQAEVDRTVNMINQVCTSMGNPPGSPRYVPCALSVTDRLTSSPDPWAAALGAFSSGYAGGRQAIQPLPAPAAPPPTRCTSQIFGNMVYTNCP